MTVKAITLAFSIMACLALVLCQRPSYAGSRPPLGNKDKYRPTQSPESIELANRFGEDTLANGASQRPPQGVPVVMAEQGFVPLANNQPSVNNRFDESTGTSTQNPAQAAGSGIQTSIPASPATTIAPSRLPLDAHGDQQLIDHLNTIPIDKRPFWYINYQAIEAQRNGSVSNFGPIASRGSFFGK